jgi:polysaccharide export outer membrane protein
VIGEVREPGTYYVNENSLNLFQALSLAGDMTDLGNRRKVKILRTTIDGNTESHVLDIRDENLLTSEYFYLHPHDIIYVEPVRLRPMRINLTQVALFLTAAAAVFIAVNSAVN